MDKVDYMIGAGILLAIACIFGTVILYEVQMTQRCQALIEAGVRDSLLLNEVCE